MMSQFYGLPWVVMQNPTMQHPQQVFYFAPTCFSPNSFGAPAEALVSSCSSQGTDSSVDNPCQLAMVQSEKMKPKVGRPRKHIKKEDKWSDAKAKRNGITNIGNQLFTFVHMRRKHRKIIERLYPDLTSEQLSAYYQYAKRLKQEVRGYVSLERLSEVWNCRPDPRQQLYHRMVRKLCSYYLQQKLPLAFMTSKKLTAESRVMHLSLRRRIMVLLQPK